MSRNKGLNNDNYTKGQKIHAAARAAGKDAVHGGKAYADFNSGHYVKGVRDAHKIPHGPGAKHKFNKQVESNLNKTPQQSGVGKADTSGFSKLSNMNTPHKWHSNKNNPLFGSSNGGSSRVPLGGKYKYTDSGQQAYRDLNTGDITDGDGNKVNSVKDNPLFGHKHYDTSNLPGAKDKHWRDPDHALLDQRQSEDPVDQNQSQQGNQHHRLPKGLKSHLMKAAKATTGKNGGKDNKKNSIKKNARRAKEVGKAAMKTEPIWEKILLGNIIFRAGLKLANKLMNYIQPFLNMLKPIGHLMMGAVKGVWGAVKGLGGLAVKGAAGLGHLAKGALSGTTHLVMHPFATIGSGISAIHHTFFAGTAASNVALAKAAIIAGVCIGGYNIGMHTFFTKTADELTCAVEQIKQDITDSSSFGGATGAWTQKGTKNYNLAKAIYIDSVKLGMNSNQAAGVVGNAVNEGAGNINTKATLDFGETDGSGDGGKGLFQFTPGAAGGGTLEAYESWCSKQHKNPWGSPATEIEGLMAIKGATGKLKSSHASSPSEGARNWYFSCEDSVDNGTLSSKREPAANKAYAMFNGLAGQAGNADMNDANASGAASAACGNNSSSDSADGTGSVKEKPDPNSIYSPGHVPSDMKQFIHSPTSVGMHYGSGSGWPDPGGECVNFSVSYFDLLWNAHHSNIPGNGIDIASGWSHVMDGKMSTTPHAGAVASSSNSRFTGGNPAGHTFVVEHVLANGDYIIAEENWPAANGSPGCGDDVSKPNTWVYALIPKDMSSTKFFMPSSKYHLNWNK